MKKSQYPQIEKLGLKIYLDKKIAYIKGRELEPILEKHGIKEIFGAYFGARTCLLLDDGDIGSYPWDVEPVLERIFTGKLTGTQLMPD